MFNSKAYFLTYIKQFSKKHFYKVFLILFVVFLTRDIIKNLVINEVIVKISKALGNNLGNSIAIFLILLYGCIYLINKIRKKQFINPTSIASGLIICIFYYYVFRLDKSYAYYRLCYTNIYWVDCILLSLLLLFSDYNYIGRPLPKVNVNNFLEDFEPSNKDLFSRSDYAKEISDTIKNTTTEKSFAIAIIAEWGYGKTFFINKIEQYLNEDPNDNIIIPFNPWQTEGVQKTLQLFFDALEDKLGEYDTKVAKIIKDYADKLLDIDDSTISKVTKFSLGEIVSASDSLETKAQAINNLIKRIGKRVIIIVDDIDRLSGDEVILIMRLIRNTANFNNVFFLAAFDYNYVTNILSKNKYITNKEKYLEKIFQMQVVLPPIPGNAIRKSIRDCLNISLPLVNPTDEQIAFDKAIVSLSYDENDLTATLFSGVSDTGLIESMLENIRDIKRFTNGFKITYRAIGDEVDVNDLMLLELIKFKFPSIFKFLSNRELISLGPNINKWIVNTGNLNKILNNEKYCNKINIPLDKIDLLRESLLKLFDHNNSSSSRSILLPVNFRLYFNYQLSDIPSIREFNEVKGKNSDELKKLVDKAATENRTQGLINIIEGIIVFSNTTEFENTIISLIYISKEEKFKANVAYALNAIFQKEQSIIKNCYNGDYTVYKNSLENILLDSSLPEDMRSSIALERLRSIIYGRNDTVFQAYELKDLIFQIFEYSIKNTPDKELNIYILYYNNIESIDPVTNKVTLSTRASKLFRDYLNSYPTQFMKTLIRSYMIPNFEDEYVFAPFIDQIFGDNNNFIDFVKKQGDTECTKFLLEKFNEYVNNNRSPIKIENFAEINPC